MKNLFTIICFVLTHLTQAGNLTQNIRGKVWDADTKKALPGAVLVVQHEGKEFGTITDEQGYYLLSNIPLGRVQLNIFYTGFEPQIFQNLELIGGKELIVDVQMEESSVQLDEVLIETNKSTESKNEFATMSVRQFSVEESKRYAGGRNDISRMASNFAGVATANDGVNDIVIRGNSPTGLLWRMEGIDIFNPNHFGALGATGGPVSMLNNNNLANSDFYTAAFPSMYGNALSGVFDLSLRNGNYAKHEFLGQIGFNGFELGAEGPLNKNKKSSYLINYRYSVLGLMQNLGLQVGTGTGVPQYQDLNLKINLPETKLGSFSFFALLGNNNISFMNSKFKADELPDDFYTNDNQDVINKNELAIVGMHNTHHWSDKTYGKLIVALQHAKNITEVDSFDRAIRDPFNFYRMGNQRQKISGHYFVHHKINAKNKVRIGIMADQIYFTMSDSVFVANRGEFQNTIQAQGNTLLAQSYIQWQYTILPKLKLNSGLRAQYLHLNQELVAEPRVGLKYQTSNKNHFSAAYGRHHQMQSMETYFYQTYINPGVYLESNTQLKFSRSEHFAVGYERFFPKSWSFKSELYYQNLSNIPVQQQASAYSVLNHGTFNTQFSDSLVNKGSGFNYGVEFTVQKSMEKGNYLMSTLSLFDSKYKGSDNILRSTAFNGNFIYNLVAGKEINLPVKEGKKTKKVLNLDTKLTYAGGARYTPLDLEASKLKGGAVYQNDKAFSEQFDAFFRWDIRAGIKLIRKKYTEEYVLDIQNVTNRNNPFAKNYNALQQQENNLNQLGIFPMFQYRITF